MDCDGIHCGISDAKSDKVMAETETYATWCYHLLSLASRYVYFDIFPYNFGLV